MGFVHALMPYVFGGDDPTRGGRIEGMQTPAAPARCGWRWRWPSTPAWRAC